MEELQILERFWRLGAHAVEARITSMVSIISLVTMYILIERSMESLMNPYADEPKLFHSYIRQNKRFIMAVWPKALVGPCE